MIKHSYLSTVTMKMLYYSSYYLTLTVNCGEKSHLIVQSLLNLVQEILPLFIDPCDVIRYRTRNK